MYGNGTVLALGYVTPCGDVLGGHVGIEGVRVLMQATELSQSQELEQAFQTFTQASGELTTFYSALESRVDRLNDELATLRSERLAQFIDNERLLRRFERLLQALPGGVVVLDGEGRITSCNPVALRLLEEPLAGQWWRDVVARVVSPRADDGHDVSLANGLRVNISTQSLVDEPGQIILITDVTETRALQEQLSRNKRLSAMGEMAASIAHQIRTPLSTALLYASSLGRTDLEPATQHRFVSRVISGLRDLEKLITDVLMFARGHEFDVVDLPVIELLAQVQTAVEHPLEKSGHRLEILNEAGEARLLGNGEALASALQSLLENAMQACEQPGIVRIQVRQQGTDLIFRISDNGRGIPEALRERIFEPFFTTRSGGTGLGLAIARTIVEAHQGQLWLDECSSAGTTFAVKLPAQPPRQEGEL